MNLYHELAKLMLNRRSDDIPDSDLIISGAHKELPEYHWCKKCVWATNLGDRYMCPFVEGSCVRFPDTIDAPDFNKLTGIIRYHHDYEKTRGNANA